MGDWLDSGDKVASVVAALAAVVSLALTLTVRHGRRVRASALTDTTLDRLLRAQIHDASRHRYRFFGTVPPLSSIYVPQQVSGPASAELTTGVHTVLSGRHHAILVGGAGAGKSALAAIVVADAAKAAHAARWGKVITVSVTAADIVDQPLPVALARACGNDLKVNVDAAVFDDPPVRHGRWRIIIDGLDEIIDSNVRVRLLSSLHGWLSDPPTPWQFIVTSRPLPDGEMTWLRRPGVDVFELQPFGRDNLDTFARHWFGERNPGQPEAASALAIRFIARVAGARLGPVARVPLLATIAAMVFEQDRDRPLPSSRAELYEKFVAHILSGRHELGQLREAIRATLDGQGVAAARFIAWLEADFPVTIGAALDAVGSAYVDNPQIDIVATAAGWIHDRSRYDLAAAVPNGEQLIRDLLLATGVLAFRGRRMRFLHQSFAEFFAARHRAATFNEAAWRQLMNSPSTRSLAAFMVASRVDSDRLIAGLLHDGFDPVWAADLLADGVPVRSDTRRRVIDTLVANLSTGLNSSETLRVLRELSVDADVVSRLADLATDESVGEWIRAIAADAVAEADKGRGVRLLREVAAQLTDPEARRFADEQLFKYGAAAKPVEWGAERGGGGNPLGGLGRRVLTDRVTDPGIDDAERVDAAIRLADDGEDGALYGVLETPGINYIERIRAAAALADRGDDAALLALGAGSTDSDYYVASSNASHFLQFNALRTLHRRGHPDTAELLTDFVATTNASCTYGAAAMLSDTGDFEALLGLLTNPQVHPLIAVAAARRMAVAADAATLQKALRLVAAPRTQAWIAAGIPEQSNNPLHRSALAGGERFELYAIRAALGDAQARHWLRRKARWTLRPQRRRRAVSAIAAAGDANGIALIRKVAQTGWSLRRRLHASATLGRLETGDEWHALRQLTGSPRSRTRLRASARIAHETGDRSPLLDLILDDRVPTRHRVRAADILGRSVDRAATDLSDELKEEYPPFGPGTHIEKRRSARQSFRFGESSVGVWRRLPPPCWGRLHALTDSPATSTRLLFAIADAGLPRETALDLLTSIAQNPGRSQWNRVRAARTLAMSGDPRGEQILRVLAGDGRVMRILRWFILLTSDQTEQWPEFAEHTQRLYRIDEGSPLLRLPRLGTLMLTRPNTP